MYKNILIIKMSSLGDVLHTLPFAAELRKLYPEAKISWLVHPQFAGFVPDPPTIDEVIYFDKKKFNSLGFSGKIAYYKEMKELLHSKHFDLVIDMQGLFKSAVLAAISGCKNRIGYCEMREGSGFISQAIKGEHSKDHVIERYLDVARYLGAKIDELEFPMPNLDAERASLVKKLNDIGFCEQTVPGTPLGVPGTSRAEAPDRTPSPVPHADALPGRLPGSLPGSHFGMPNTPYELQDTPRFPVERCGGLSVERVRKELDKMLLGPYAGRGCMLFMATGLFGAKCRVKENGQYLELDILPELEHLVGLHQNPRFHCYDTWEHTLLAIDNSPRELEIRWAMLLHDVGKGLSHIRKLNKEGQPSDHGHEAESAKMAEVILTRLRYPAPFIKRVVWLVAQHMRFAPMLVTGEKTLLRWVRTEAHNGYFRKQEQLVEAYTQLVEVFLADMGATWAKDNPQLMNEGRDLGNQVIELCKTRMPIATSDLELSGKELMDMVGQENVKNMLSYLLHRVQNGDLTNEHDQLWRAAEKNRQRKGKKNE